MAGRIMPFVTHTARTSYSCTSEKHRDEFVVPADQAADNFLVICNLPCFLATEISF